VALPTSSSLCISVPPDLVERIQAVVHSYPVESLFGEASIRERARLQASGVIGPAYQGYIEWPHFLSTAHPGVRALCPSDQVALRQLADACEVEAGNTRESLPMNRTSLAVLWMVSLQRLPAIGPAGERRPTLAS